MPAESFSDAHRRSIGVCLAQLRELSRTIRSYDVGAAQLQRIDEAIDAIVAATGARRPSVPRNGLNAALVQMLILEEELRPRRLSAYGTVDADGEALLDAHVQQLVDLTNELLSKTKKVRP